MEAALGRAIRDQFEGSFEGKLLRTVSSARELVETTSADPTSLEEARIPTVTFVDKSTLPELASLGQQANLGAVIAVCDGSRITAASWIRDTPWLSHVIGVPLLTDSMAREHLRNVIAALGSKTPRLVDWIASTVPGRRTKLTHASMLPSRLERMQEFLTKNGVEAGIAQQLRDTAHALLTNAFYEAPVAAGVVKHKILPAQDVALPEENACDIAYGCDENVALVRVRDPFGSLSRQRIVDVLGRFTNTSGSSDGASASGLLRVMAAASFVAISVVADHHTEFLVGIANRHSASQRPFAFHLYFKDSTGRRSWKFIDEDTSLNNSVTIASSPVWLGPE